MTQEEFNAMLQTAIAQGVLGYYTSKFSGEEIDSLLTKLTIANGGTGATFAASALSAR